MLCGRIQLSAFGILLIDFLLYIQGSHQFMDGVRNVLPKSQPKQKALITNVSSSPVDASNGVDDILKDTILLLDVLDEKLSAVKNKTPNAMMRDNLRALNGAYDDYQQKHQHQVPAQLQQSLGGSPIPVQLDSRQLDETSFEEALVKMADGYTLARRSDQDATASEPLIAVATNANEEQQIVAKQLINPIEGHSLAGGIPNSGQSPPLAAPQESVVGVDPIVQQQQQSNSNGRGSKRAKQLVNVANSGPNVDDSNQLASDSTERHIKFTLDLMQSIFSSQSYSAKTNLIESFLISPLSIQMVLMMMHLGARGQTRREISNCLYLTTPASSSSTAASTPTLAAYGSSSSPDKSLFMMQHHHQQQGGSSNAANVGNDPGATASDSMSSKLKRRHQVSSENVKQSVNNGNNNVKPQQQQPSGANLRQQQQQPTSSPLAAAASAANVAYSMANGNYGNPHELFGGAMRNLLKDPIVTKALTSANQIFLQKNLPLSPQYEWAIRHYYAADVKLVDFQHQSSGSSDKSKPLNSTTTNVTQGEHHLPKSGRDEQLNGANNNNNIQQMINDWIERQTRGKISNFLSSPISTSTLMMAINVLYFKGDWQYKFDPSDTETDAWFTQANGKTVKTPMMVNRLPLAFAHDPAMKTSVIELPYKAQRLGLFLLLPDEVSGIFHTMQMLNSTSFANLISSMRKPMPGADQGASGINVRIPKFSIESSPRLSQILSQQLGLRSLFMPDVADLSGMFGTYQSSSQPIKRSSENSSSAQQSFKSMDNGDNNNQQVPLQVGLDELLHKAVLQVDEQGSVAAASSATIVERVGLFNSNYFEADHPFLLFLMDKQTGLVLFSGVFAGNNLSNSNQESPQQRH